MLTQAILFPFDSFGAAGCGEGAWLLGDALEEILEDAERETQPCRSVAFRDQVSIQSCDFDTAEAITRWRETGNRLLQEVSNDFVLWFGGNHLSVLPVYDTLGADDLVIQLDAHLDVHQFDENTTELNHGNFLLHIDGPKPVIAQLGHRDLFVTPEQAGAVYDAVFSAEDWHLDMPHVEKKLTSLVKSAKRVWLDIDCDAFDPMAMPAVKQPLPFGLSPLVLMQLWPIMARKLAGISISELDPTQDRDQRSIRMLSWYLEWVLLKRYES